MLLYFLVVFWPLSFLVSLLLLPDGIWKAGQTLQRNPEIGKKAEAARSSEIDRLEEKFGRVVRKSSASIDGTYQIEKIYRAIQYVIARHDWYETQRTIILGFVLTISGLVFAGMAAYLGAEEGQLPESAKLIIASIGLTLFIGVFSIIHLYNKELDQDRPYRLIADIRHWFFRYSLSERTKDYQERMDYANIASDVLAQKEKFFDRILGVSSLEESIREDLEQLFILHVLVKHKSDSLQKMRSCLMYLVGCLVSSVVCFFFYYAFCK